MRYLKSIYNFLNEEALPLNIAKQIVKYGKKERPKGIVDKLNELFNNQQRVYIPIDDSVKGETEIKIENFLSSIDYKIKDYKVGIAFQTDNPKREIRIGKLLNKEKQTELLKLFTEDTNRALSKVQSEYSIVICQHPYDVTAMTTGRSWTSCLEILAGVNRKYLPEEVRSGTITVYYIKTSDRNINAPIGRVNVKLYSENSEGDSYSDAKSEFPSYWVWIPDTGVYGNFPDKALRLLYKWLMSKQDYNFSDYYYKLKGLYNYKGTAWEVKLRPYDDVFKVSEIQTEPEIYAEDEDFWDDEDHTDWNDRDNWVNELSDIDGLGHYASSYDYEEFEADVNGIRTCDVIYTDLVINRDSSTYTDFPDNFQISRLDDTLKIDLSNCVNKYIFDYVKMSSLYDCDVTIEGESFNTECESGMDLISNLTAEIKYDIIKSLENRTLTLINCDVKSVQSTLDIFFKKYPTSVSSPDIEINTCLEYLEYLEDKTSIEELEPYEINFLLELGVSESRVSSDMDLEDLEIYKLVVDKYSEILKIPNIFKYYNFEYNVLRDLYLINDYFFNQNKSTYLMEFKFKEFFDSLDLITLEIKGYDNLKIDLSTLPKSTHLKLSWLDTLEDLTGLRPNVYENIEIYNCDKFKSPKGLSLKNPNKPNSFKFDILNYPDFTFFDELVEIHPQFLNDVKILFKENPKGGYRHKYSLNVDYVYTVGKIFNPNPTYGNIIKYLEKVSDEDWYKTEDGINEFLNKVINGSGTWTINEKGEVDVKGSVYISKMNIKEIPIKFGRVTGFFNCEDNNLTTLKNCPYFVGDDFRCNTNKLTNLIGCPSEVGGIFVCSNNKLTSLVGCPTKVKELYCSYSELTNLIGCPTDVRDINVRYCSLTTLQGAPKELNSLNCEGNYLKDLIGSPIKVGDFDCTKNILTTLQGAPKEIGLFKCQLQKNKHEFTEEEVREVISITYKVYT